MQVVDQKPYREPEPEGYYMPVVEPEVMPKGKVPREDFPHKWPCVAMLVVVALNAVVDPATQATQAVNETVVQPVVQAVEQKVDNRKARQELEVYFEGASDSLVARVIGAAEGTRGRDGSKNPAYSGHTDPGNGVWNLGTFSYQHGASSPEEADEKQLKRLLGQVKDLVGQAQKKGVQMDIFELLNGADLANQAPAAALERGGYVDRLIEGREKGLTGFELVSYARVYSYMNPDTGQWAAPGLGNSLSSITHDQERRMTEIQGAMDRIRSDFKANPSDPSLAKLVEQLDSPTPLQEAPDVSPSPTPSPEATPSPESTPAPQSSPAPAPSPGATPEPPVTIGPFVGGDEGRPAGGPRVVPVYVQPSPSPSPQPAPANGQGGDALG